MRILALDIGGTAIKIGVVNEKGEIVQQEEIPTQAEKGGEHVMNKILKVISKYKDIDRIGISAAGQIDEKKGSVIYATENLPGWTGMRIKKRIERMYSIPTAVENDVNAAAIGESYYGAGKDTKSFLCLTFGTGIGGAIIENKEIYRGAFGSAGEFGHMILHSGGKSCTCGGKGCYEVYGSTSALVRNTKSILQMEEELNGKMIFDKMLRHGNPYKEIVEDWLREVTMGLASIIHIFNPSLIVLGGGIMKQPYSIEWIENALPEYIMPNYRKVRVKGALLGNAAGLLGASIVAMRLE